MPLFVSMLEGMTTVQEFISDPNPSSSNEMDARMKKYVYSFGITVLEAHVLKSDGNLMNLVDPRLGSNFNKE
ncbi:unnamed protein product [Malus baccata var. baccata]